MQISGTPGSLCRTIPAALAIRLMIVFFEKVLTAASKYIIFNSR